MFWKYLCSTLRMSHQYWEGVQKYKKLHVCEMEKQSGVSFLTFCVK